MSTLEDLALPRIVLVTGTGTEVGKTIATAALAAVLSSRGSDIAAVKPVQTGLMPGDSGDADVIQDLSGVTTHEWHRLRDPLAPDVAAAREGVTLPPVAKHAQRVVAMGHDIVLVEGAGGLLVRLDARGGTLADMGSALRYTGVSAGVVLVASAGLGTLNSVALTAEALTTRRVPLLGVIVGVWPDDPGLAERTNLDQIPSVAGAPLLGVLPRGVADLPPDAFRSRAPLWFSPATWDTMSS